MWTTRGALVGAIAGCVACATAGVAERCLQIPVSGKTGAVDLEPCRSALVSAPERRDVFARYARLLVLQTRYPELVHWSHKVLARDASRADAAYYLAVALRKLGRCADAVRFYRLYALRQPRDPDPHYAVGMCLEQLGETAAAREAYEKYLAMERRERYAEWKSLAARRIERLSQLRTEVAPASAPAAVAPVAPRAAAPAPKIARRDTSDCRQLLSVVQGDPFATDAYEKLAMCFSAHAQHDELVKHMRTALRDNPAWVRGWLHLARAQAASGQGGSAAVSLRKACQEGVTEACERPASEP